ncbi:FAD-dependent oxidoreductase [Desulfofundulus thermosubterraneus]|uniref:Electron transfer flavoprotein-quinone oxidoreductase n=1 Tax=Desulfofundulus thermosubterraneus DSM 16057 TaxID=1121432 RepID=A0A1M6GRP0_9FIRM|nr:electron transfer flavoprotein-quinone oxidoreductase [Desulfofundulus thermosubterraneus DSM 16057]
MSDDKFTAIVIGGGPSGSTAAYVLAKEGLDVLLIEKGDTSGSKNMFGGRMYSHALNRIIPGFWEEAPVERAVTKEIITFLTEDKSVSVICQNDNWAKEPYHSFTLLRAEFDRWLASKAEEAGAIVATSIKVDDLIIENNKVVGIKAGEDEMYADVIIAADGVNSLMAQKAGLRKDLEPKQVATGIKQIIKLSKEKINDRFQVTDSYGVAQLFVGHCTKGLHGGGFLYTNKDTISIGLVINISALRHNTIRLVDLLEDFKNHPSIAPIIEDGEVEEYSAHLVPEAGINMKPQLIGEGFLVVGDAAGFVLNLGFLVRGMDFAIASGEAAAKAVIEAKKSNDFSKSALLAYERYLKQSFVMQHLEIYRKAPHFLENERLYGKYPALAANLLTKMFTVDGGQPRRLFGTAMNEIKMSGLSLAKLAMDGWKGMRSL